MNTYPFAKQGIYNIQPATQTKPDKMEKIKKYIADRKAQCQKEQDHNHKMCNFGKAAEMAFKQEELIRLEIFLVEIENG